MERLAQADRQAIGMRFGEPCDPRSLAEMYDISRILESVADYVGFFGVDETGVEELCGDLDAFSSATVALPNWD